MSKIKSYHPQPTQDTFLQKLYNFLNCKACSYDKTIEQATEITIESPSTAATIMFKETNPNVHLADFLNPETDPLFIKENCIVLSKLLIFASITALNLSSNALGNKISITLAGIFSLSSLQYLNLNSNLIEDEGIKAIFANLPPSIQALYVGDNKFKDCGLAALIERLPDMQIKFLDICCNSITTVGLKQLALILPQTKIISLDVRGNFSTKEGVDLIEANIPPTTQYLNTMCYNLEGIELVGKVIGNVIEYSN